MKKFLNRITDISVTRPKLTIFLSILLILACGYLVRYTKMTLDPTEDLPESLPEKIFYDEVKEMFPSRDFILIALETESIFDKTVIKDIYTLSEELKTVKGVYSVSSITSLQILSGDEENIFIDKPFEDNSFPQTPEEIELFKQKIINSDLPLENIISKDGEATAIMVMLKKSADEPRVISDIDTILVNTDISGKYTTHLVGEPVTDLYSSMLIGKNMQRLFPITILVIFILLFLSFFSLRGVFIPVVGVIGSAVISMGVMAGMGIPFGHGTSIMPILIASIAVADSIHILRKYYLLASEGVITSSKELVKMTMDEMNVPVFLTTVTTMAGFLSLGVSQIKTVTHLSIFTAFGVFIALLYSIFFIPATLSLIKMPKVKKLKKRETRISRPFTAVGNFTGKRPVTVMIIMLAVLLLASAGFWKLEIDSNPIENFNKEHPLRKADTLINGKFAGSYPLTFVVMGEPGSVIEPGVLKAIDDVESYARTLDDVGGSQSIVPFIKKLNMIIYGGEKSEFRVPGEQERVTGLTVVDDEIVEAEYIVDGKDIIENYLTLLDMSGKPDDLANMLNNGSSATQFTLFLKNGRKSNLEKVKLDLDAFIEERFDGLPVEINATGMPVLSLVMNNLVTRSQVESILIAVALVIILCSILFRSVYAGLFTTIPLAVSVFLNFCIMGLLGIQLEVMTMLVASIVIGVGVDYAIHYVYKMMSDVSKGLKPVEANLNTMRSEGVAIFFNAIVVAFGFLVMVFSDVRPVRWMGVLISMTMITSAIGALFILPPLLIKLNPKFLFKLSQRGKK